MFRQLPKQLLTAFNKSTAHHPALIAPLVRSAWHSPVRKNIFLSQPQKYQRFFSTTTSTTQHDFKSNFAMFLKENFKKDYHEIKDEALRAEVKSLCQTLNTGMQKNLDEQPDFVKIIHKNMSDIVQGADMISIPIGKFSNQALSIFFEELDKQGYAASVSWLSQAIYYGWIINDTDTVLSFCKKIPGITDHELSPMPLSAEECDKAFRKG